MVAFENGTITEDMFGDRVRALGQKAADLESRRATIAGAIEAASPPSLPSDAEIAALADQLRTVANDAPDTVRKAIVQAFVHRLHVVDRQRVEPTYRVLPDLPTDAEPDHPADNGALGVRAMTPAVRPVR